MKRSLCFISALAFPLTVLAQGYPTRPITLVVPYTPGTGIDIIARTVGPKISERWGQPVVVENRPGASGNIGAAQVAKARPDGHTMMVTVNTFTMTPALYPSLQYDPIKDFTPTGQVARGNLALVVHAGLPVRDLQQLVIVVGHLGEAIPFWLYRIDYMHRTKFSTMPKKRHGLGAGDHVRPLARRPGPIDVRDGLPIPIRPGRGGDPGQPAFERRG